MTSAAFQVSMRVEMLMASETIAFQRSIPFQAFREGIPDRNAILSARGEIMFTMTAKGDSMHSHDRTMIAKLGFADADRKNDEHDLACRYLICPTTSQRLISQLGLDEFRKAVASDLKELNERDARKPFRGLEASQPMIEAISGHTEQPIGKGEGQYATTIGFIDALISGRIVAGIRGEEFRPVLVEDGGHRRWEDQWMKHNSITRFDVTIVCEVKIQKVGIGEAIRQIKFYRSFMGGSDGWRRPTYFVLGTRYEVSQQEVDLMKNEGIHHLYLGDGFSTWMSERARDNVPSSSSIRL